MSENPLTIAFIGPRCPNPDYGGIETMTYTLAREFSARGHACVAIYYGNDSPDELPDRSFFAGFEPIGSRDGSNFDLASVVDKYCVGVIVNNACNNMGINEMLDRFTPRRRCPVISVYHFMPGWEMIRIKHDIWQETPRGFGEIMQRGFDILRYQSLLRKRWRRIVLRRQENVRVSDMFVVLSQGFIGPYANMYDIPEDQRGKISAIGNALRFPYSPDTSSLSGKAKEVLIVSRLDEAQKNISAALKIWGIIERQGTFPDWKLVIVGYGKDRDRYIRMMKRMKLKGVSFEGQQNPLPYYRRAAVQMVTSRCEGFGIVITEAMQNGVVPVAFDTFGALHDIITDGVSGFIVPPFDLKAYARVLECLMSDEGLREKAAVNAIRESAKFTVSAIADKWVDLFARLTE